MLHCEAILWVTYTAMNDMQQMWSYLEPLFINSEEVKQELPKDTERFERVDGEVKATLNELWRVKKVCVIRCECIILASLQVLSVSMASRSQRAQRGIFRPSSSTTSVRLDAFTTIEPTRVRLGTIRVTSVVKLRPGVPLILTISVLPFLNWIIQTQVMAACNEPDLLTKLENLVVALEKCKKSLSEYLR